MGAGTISIAVAQGVLEQYRKMDNAIDIGGIGLSTLGLFYDVHFDGHLKTQDHILVRIRREAPYIDPGDGNDESLGHEELNRLYQNWARFWATHRVENEKSNHKPADESGLSKTDHESVDESGQNRADHNSGNKTKMRPADRFCNKLSFLYGLPYREANLSSVMHENLDQQFGGIPTDMYLQAVRNTRTGWATPFVIGGSLEEIADYEERYIDETARSQFDEIPKILLITGKENRLWHRNSIDFMYEWLLRGSLDRFDKVQKSPVTRYGHQDLFWGEEAHKDVFARRLEWLLGKPPELSSEGETGESG